MITTKSKAPSTFLLEAEIKDIIYSVYNVLRRGLLFDVRFITQSIPIIINNNLNETIMVFKKSRLLITLNFYAFNGGKNV
jgi:hypothetical protein